MQPVSGIVNVDGRDSFFKTAMRIELEAAEDTLYRPSTAGNLEESTNAESREENINMSQAPKSALPLLKGSPLLRVRSSSPRTVSPERLNSPFFQRARSGMRREKVESAMGISKVFNMNRIAKALVVNHKTRLQRLEEAGNITSNAPLKKFDPDSVKPHLFKVLQDNLRNVQYDPILCCHLSQSLSEETRNVVKALKFPRYKFVSLVTIGQSQNSTLSMSSRSVWDCTTDNHVCAEYRNQSLYAVALVFATFMD